MEKIPKTVKAFVTHGFESTSESGGQWCGHCPLCAKEDHFFVNEDSQQWDCKVCGESGNLTTFLEKVSARNEEFFKTDKFAKRTLAQDRSLPAKALVGWAIGYDGSKWTIPTYNHRGRVTDLRHYAGKGVMSTPSVKTGMLGLGRLNGRKGRVWVCEGEWDAIALNWLLRKVGMKDKTVAVPGASVFKKEWAEFFQGWDCVIAYDADGAGERGEITASSRLSGYAKSVSYVHWPDEVPEGFDLRDWIVHGCVELRTPRKCWTELKALVKGKPRTKVGLTGDEDDDEGVRRDPIAREALIESYKQWLKLDSMESVAVMMACMIANRIDGDPLWMFFVAPPGGSKSELLMSLASAREAMVCSALTPHALISGMNTSGGDPSLIPRLDGKVLVVKDFTTTLTMFPAARDEIFGQLRDAYDGRVEKQFGNGVYREYESSFGIVAGVTPAIDSYASLSAGLGERFLKYRLPAADPLTEYDTIVRALGNVGSESAMRSELKESVAAFLEGEHGRGELPTVAEKETHQLVSLGMLVARLRGVVDRDMYHREELKAKPSHELGTRLAKQLKKLAMGLALFWENDTVGMDEMRVVARVALGSTSDKVEEVVRTIWEHEGDPPTRNQIVEEGFGLTSATCYRVLEDLCMLGVVLQRGASNRKRWRLSRLVQSLIEDTDCFSERRTRLIVHNLGRKRRKK